MVSARFGARADNLHRRPRPHLVLCLVVALTDSWGPALGVGLPAFLVPLLISRSAPASWSPDRGGLRGDDLPALLIHQTRG